ncbi:MAG: hypothetical protein IPG66_05665 [Hydrogenophilales bacterium]|nr:hypothetical protein [Hydrogenophilales bacterium]
MVAYNFKERFAPAIQSGAKCQTIRARGKRRPPKVGEALQLYQGLRTKEAKKLLGKVACTSVEAISISPRTGVVQMIRGNYWDVLDADEIEALAKADGFNSADDFFDFFLCQYGSNTVSGYLIKWTSFPQPAHERSNV